MCHEQPSGSQSVAEVAELSLLTCQAAARTFCETSGVADGALGVIKHVH